MSICNSDTLRYKVFDRKVENSKESKLIELLEDPELQPFLKNYLKRKLIELFKDHEVQAYLKPVVESTIAASELKILQRLSALEQMLGKDVYGPDEAAAPSLPQRIEKIEEKINSPNFKPPEEPEIQPTTKTETRAASLVKYAKETGKDHLTAHEITSFLKNKLPDSCKLDENIQNIRKVKQDVLTKAASMFPGVFLSKKSTGHHEVRLVLGSPS